MFCKHDIYKCVEYNLGLKKQTVVFDFIYGFMVYLTIHITGTAEQLVVLFTSKISGSIMNSYINSRAAPVQFTDQI